MHIVVKYLPINVLLAFIVAIIAVIVFMITKKPSPKKLFVFFVTTLLAAIYVFVACGILFNITRYGIYGDTSPFYGNYVPFKTIIEYVERGRYIIFAMQVGGNILITLPLPFVVWLFLRKLTIKQVCLVSLIITALIEPLQLLINIFLGGPSNIIDVDDLILNLAGCVLGLLCLKAANSIYKKCLVL